MVLTDMTTNASLSYDDRGIVKFKESCYADSITANQQMWAQGDIDLRQYTGDPSLWAWQYGAQLGNQNILSFNLSRRLVEAPCGYQRSHRKSTVATPVENSDQQTADEFSKLLVWSDQIDNTAETLSSAFTGANITGMNLVEVYMDYRDDPINGTVRTVNHAYNTFIIDPYFRQPDLSDCRFVLKRTFVTKAEALSLLPGNEDLIESIDYLGNRDGKFPYMPEAFNFNMKGLVTYDHFTYRDYRMQKLVIDSRKGQQMEWTGSDTDLRNFIKHFPQLEVVEQIIPTVRVAITLQDKLVYHGPNPTGSDMWPFVPVLSYYTPDSPYLQWRVQGLMRCTRDAQYVYNHRKTLELKMLESQLNSGYFAKEDSVVDPASLYKTGTGQVVWLKKDAQMTDVVKIQAGALDGSIFQISETLKDLMMEMVGSNEALMGSSVDDKAGIVEMFRAGNGLIILQRLFDQFEISQKLVAKLKVDYFQKNFTPAKVERILGHEPSQEFYSKNFGKYDIAIEESFNTATQRQVGFSQAMQMVQAGVQIPVEYLVSIAPLQNKTELLEMIQNQQQQQQQMQQAQAQSAQQQEQATLQMAQARAAADFATAKERESRIEENKSLAFERIAEAHKDNEMAVLNRAKAIKEIEGMTLEQVEKLMALSAQMQEQDQGLWARQAVQESMLMKQLEALNNNGMNTMPMAQPPIGRS